MFSTDRMSLLLGVGAIVVTIGVGTCSTNARIADVNRRLDELNANVNRRFDDLNADWNARFDDLNAGDPVPENRTAPASPSSESPTAPRGPAPENPTAPAGSPAGSAPESRAFPRSPPLGPATQLARQRDSLSSFRAPMHSRLRGESLTVTGVLWDVGRWDGRIFVQVYEDPEDEGVLVVAAFDPQTWDEPLGELARGTRVRLHGTNAVAGLVAVEMDGTEFERLAEAAPAGSAPESQASPPSPPRGPAAQLARQRDSLTSFQAATHPGVRADNLTTIGIVWDVWRWDGRIFVQVYEDPEDQDVLVVAAFDAQTWDEPLGDLARGTHVRLHGVNAVADSLGVKMDGTQLERLAEATP